MGSKKEQELNLPSKLGVWDNYPEWKLLVWRYVRVFTAAFLGVFSVDTFILGGFSLDETLLRAAVAAGIGAVVKMFRDWITQGDETHPVDKLPL